MLTTNQPGETTTAPASVCSIFASGADTAGKPTGERPKPPPVAIVLGEEHERRRVGRRPVLQLQLELAAGAGPGGVGLPAVGVVVRDGAEGESSSRARPAGRDR